MYSECLINSSPFKYFIDIKKLNFYCAFCKAIANKRLLAPSHLSARPSLHPSVCPHGTPQIHLCEN